MSGLTLSEKISILRGDTETHDYENDMNLAVELLKDMALYEFIWTGSTFRLEPFQEDANPARAICLAWIGNDWEKHLAKQANSPTQQDAVTGDPSPTPPVSAATHDGTTPAE